MKYRAAADELSVSTLPQTANFGSGVVNGYITRVTVVPAPGVTASLLTGMFGLLAGARFRRASSDGSAAGE